MVCWKNNGSSSRLLGGLVSAVHKKTCEEEKVALGCRGFSYFFPARADTQHSPILQNPPFFILFCAYFSFHGLILIGNDIGAK